MSLLLFEVMEIGRQKQMTTLVRRQTSEIPEQLSQPGPLGTLQWPWLEQPCSAKSLLSQNLLVCAPCRQPEL